MKILIPCKCSDGPQLNYFLQTLRDALKAKSVDVTTDVAEFWNPSQDYDIIHFQWPEALFDSIGINTVLLAALQARIMAHKRDGVKMVITRHNERKHYAVNPLYDDLYRVVESACDAILHMGEYSREAIEASHCSPGVLHRIIPHHTYPNINRSVSREVARKKLGWREREKIVLIFGSFRDDEERLLVLNAAHNLRKQKVRIVAPQLFRRKIKFTRGNRLSALLEIRYRLRFLKYGLFLRTGSFVDDETMALMFAATDLVLIQRKHILNSGNLPMAYYFGKVVVGPNVGNVGELLRRTGNPTFNPQDEESIAAAVLKGFADAGKGLGERNRQFADLNWSSQTVAEKIISVYRECLE